MKKTNKILALLLALMMVFAIVAGCAPQEEVPPPPPEPAPELPAPPPPQPPPPPLAPEPEPEPDYQPTLTLARDGTFTVVVPGYEGIVPVTTTFRNGAITNIEIGPNLETPVFTYRGIATVIDRIITYNSVNVDTVAGSTVTTMAIRLAVSQAITEAGGDIQAYFYRPEVIPAPDETVTVDVVVVGGGLSGILAAANAANNGAQVAVLEKTTLLGGAGLRGSFSFALGTRGAIEEDEDTDTRIRERIAMWMQRELFRVDANLLHMYHVNAARAHDYLVDAGFLTRAVAPHGRYNLMQPLVARLPFYEQFLYERVIQRGGYVFLEARGESLIYENGAVRGVVARRGDGSTLTVMANAVIIATGGYGGNQQLVYERTGIWAEIGGLGAAQGDGMQMGWDIGAKVPVNMHSGIMLHQTLATADLSAKGFDELTLRMPRILTYVPSFLRVDHTGNRFADETTVLTATHLSNAAAFTGGYTYVLVSQSKMNKLMEGGLEAIGFAQMPAMPPAFRPAALTPYIPWTTVQEALDAMVEVGGGFFGETIEEVAAAAGFNVDLFVETFNNYQRFAQNGLDERFNKRAEWLIYYEYGPFYLIEATFNQLGTVVGLVVNAELQVLDANSIPIPGLFAVGNDAKSTLYNTMYTGSGDGLGFAITSGYVAGENAARFALR